MQATDSFRTGTGWWGMDEFGCWTKPQGGDLNIGLATPHEPLRAYFYLHGLPTERTPFLIEAEGIIVRGALSPNECKWIAVQLPASDANHPNHLVSIRGEISEDLSAHTDNWDRRVISIGVKGFFLCRTSDTAARMAFLEAVTLNAIDELAFNREGRHLSIEVTASLALAHLEPEALEQIA